MFGMHVIGLFFLIYILVIILILFFLIRSLVDIVKSEFKDPNLKIIWFLVVIFMGPIGIVLYQIVGKNQKISPTYSNNNFATQNIQQNFTGSTYTLNCPTCKSQLSKNNIFCKSCGTNVQSYLQVALLSNCPSCNNSINSSDVSCANCGYNIQKHKQTYLSNQAHKQTILLSNAQNTCNKCGNTQQVDDVFCENCGNKLK